MTRLEKFRQMALSNETHIKITLGSIISLIIFIVGATWVVAVKFTDVNNNIRNNTELIIYAQNDIDENSSDIKDNGHEVDRVQIDVAKIFTELSSIKTMQLRMLDILEKD